MLLFCDLNKTSKKPVKPFEVFLESFQPIYYRFFTKFTF